MANAFAGRKSKSADSPVSELSVLRHSILTAVPLNSEDTTAVMDAIKSWLINSEFGKAVQLIDKAFTTGIAEGHRDWLGDFLEESDGDIPLDEFSRGLKCISATLAESELQELLTRSSVLMQDQADFVALHKRYPELKMPKELSKGLTEVSGRLNLLKKTHPDLDFPAIADGME